MRKLMELKLPQCCIHKRAKGDVIFFYIKIQSEDLVKLQINVSDLISLSTIGDNPLAAEHQMQRLSGEQDILSYMDYVRQRFPCEGISTSKKILHSNKITIHRGIVHLLQNGVSQTIGYSAPSPSTKPSWYVPDDSFFSAI